MIYYSQKRKEINLQESSINKMTATIYFYFLIAYLLNKKIWQEEKQKEQRLEPQSLE